MLCSYFMSKLYLKLTCFCSFVFCFYIENLILFCFFCFFFKNGTWIIIFCLPCDPVPPPPLRPAPPGNCCSLPCCKEFLIGQFSCHQVSVWATRKMYKKKTKKRKRNNKKKKNSVISTNISVSVQ